MPELIINTNDVLINEGTLKKDVVKNRMQKKIKIYFFLKKSTGSWIYY